MMALDFTSKYAAMGFNLVPLKSRDKIPAVAELAAYFDRMATPDEMSAWFGIGKDHNVGIITGSISGLIVIDIDGDEAKRKFQETSATLSAKIQNAIKETMIVRTGGNGFHFYFKTDKPVTHKKLWLGEGHNEVAIKGEGGYVVAPPSIHPSGRAYELVSDTDPVFLSSQQIRELMMAFGVRERVHPNNPVLIGETTPLSPAKMNSLLDLLAPHYTDGKRNYLVLALSGYLRKQGVPKDNALRLVELLVNKTNDGERESRVLSVRRTYDKPLEEIQGYTALKELIPTDVLDKVGSVFLEQENNEMSQVYNPLTDKEASDAEKRAFLVSEIMERHRFITLADTDEILVYENGVYVEGGEKKIVSELQLLGGYEITNHIRSEILGTIRAKTYKSRDEFDTGSWINLGDCLFNIETGARKDHTPEYLSMVQVPVKHNPQATCRPIIEALYNTLQDPADVPLFLEYLAYTVFSRDNKDLQKELLMIGPPDSGKSKILDTLIALLGSKNVSAVTMQQLSTNRFAKAQLFGKLANIYADISHTRVEDLENFKAIGTADEIEAEKKGMQLFKFRPHAKLIYSANIPPKPPITVDDSFYRRWMLILCAWRETDYFTGKSRVRDPEILKKLATEENLSGLLNLIIISANRLREKKRFCRTPSTDEIRGLYDRLSNPVQLWVEECCEDVDEEPDPSKQEAHQNYVRFCKSRKIAPLNEVWMGKELASLGYTDQQIGTGKNKKRVWVGLKLKKGTGNAPFPSLTTQQRSLDNSIIEKGKDPLPVPNLEGFTN